MKNLLVILCLSLSAVACNASTTTTVPETKSAEVAVEKKEVEKKKVCINVWDAKLNKEIEKCKIIKIHEKHKGTVVPAK